jgi:hypothetical protein
MEDIDFEKKSKALREKLGEKKKNEDESVTKERMKKVLTVRDMALQQIYDYQDKTGIPSEEETEENFFKNEINQKD